MSGLSGTQIQAFLNSHNNNRAGVNPPARSMPSMSWSDDLATNASNWASQCVWSHSRTPNVGENLYATSARMPVGNFDPTTAVNSWGGEKVNYNYNNNSCANGQECGHYTQVVWADSTKVGCGVSNCPSISGLPWNGGTMVVCQYSPPGNYIGERPYQT